MSITKHGLTAPVKEADLYGVRSVFNEHTEMSGTLFTDTWPVKAGSRFFMTTEHEGVGLITWFEAPTLEEANTFLDHIKNVEVLVDEDPLAEARAEARFEELYAKGL